MFAGHTGIYTCQCYLCSCSNDLDDYDFYQLHQLAYSIDSTLNVGIAVRPPWLYYVLRAIGYSNLDDGQYNNQLKFP